MPEVMEPQPHINGSPSPEPSRPVTDRYEESLGADGPGILFDALGQTWAMVWVTQGMKATFVAWMKKQARAAIYEMKGELPEEEYREALDRKNREIERGEYNWGSERWSEFLGMRGGKMEALSYGTLFLAALLFSEKHPDLHPLTAFDGKGRQVPADTADVIRRVVEIVNDAPEAFGQSFGRALESPKAKSRLRPATAAG